MKWVHQRGIIDFDKMTDFSVNLRSQLSEVAEIRPPIIEECLTSPEGTKKYLIKLDSGSMIEMVKKYLKRKDSLCAYLPKQDVHCSAAFAQLDIRDLREICQMLKS